MTKKIQQWMAYLLIMTMLIGSMPITAMGETKSDNQGTQIVEISPESEDLAETKELESIEATEETEESEETEVSEETEETETSEETEVSEETEETETSEETGESEETEESEAIEETEVSEETEESEEAGESEAIEEVDDTGKLKNSITENPVTTVGGEIVLSIEKFVLGQGYVLEPVYIPFNDGESFVDLLLNHMGRDNLTYGGEATGAFFFMGVRDTDGELQIPAYIQNALGAGGTHGRTNEGWLGMMDYTNMSGFMYTVNGRMVDFGMSDYQMTDGDIVRIHFTIHGEMVGNDWVSDVMAGPNMTLSTQWLAEYNRNESWQGDPIKQEAQGEVALLTTDLETAQNDIDMLMVQLGYLEHLANKDSLQMAMEQGKLLLNNEALYTKDSFAVFKEAFNTAMIIAAEVAATEGQVAIVTRDLLDSIDALEIVDTPSIDELIDLVIQSIAEQYKGTSGGWQAVSMSSLGKGGLVDQEGIIQRAIETIDGRHSATDLEREIIGLSAIGKHSRDIMGRDFIGSLVNYNSDAEIPSLGSTNGYIYALLALDSGAFTVDTAAYWSREGIINDILSRQRADGGWGLGGATGSGDPDITAMAIMALAPYREESAVGEKVHKALGFLSDVQTINGGYKSWRSENSNSASMVLIALAAMNIDPLTDDRFIKEGHTVLDGLMQFKTENHTFGYTSTKENAMSTEQGFMGLVAYTQWQQGAGPYYLFQFDVTAPIPETVDKTSLAKTIDLYKKLQGVAYTSLSWHGFNLARVKAIKILEDESCKQKDVEIAEEGLIAAVANLVKIGSEPVSPSTITVHFSLQGDSLHERPSLHISTQPWIRENAFEMKAGDTVFDLFASALTREGISWDETQYGYIGGIEAPASVGNFWLYEFDNGAAAGWMYRVNGVNPSQSLRDIFLFAGDRVEFYYVDDYTKESGELGGQNQRFSPGKTLISISPGQVNEDKILIKAFTPAEKEYIIDKINEENKQVKGIISLDIKGDKPFEGIQIILDIDIMKALAANSYISLGISSDIGNILIDHLSLIAMATEKTDHMAITLKPIQTPHLQVMAPKLAMSHVSHFFEISIENKAREIVDLGGGNIQITLPASDIEDSSRLFQLVSDEELRELFYLNDRDKEEISFRLHQLAPFVMGEILESPEMKTPVRGTSITLENIEPSHFAYDPLNYLYANNVLSRDNKDIIVCEPDKGITRGEFINLLFNISKIKETDSFGSELNEEALDTLQKTAISNGNDIPFKDVFTSDVHYAGIAWACDNQIVMGKANEYFISTEPITREEMAQLTYKFIVAMEYELETREIDITFVDDDNMNGKSKESVYFLRNHGLIKGKDTGFMAADTASLGEAATVMYRLIFPHS